MSEDPIQPGDVTIQPMPRKIMPGVQVEHREDRNGLSLGWGKRRLVISGAWLWLVGTALMMAVTAWTVVSVVSITHGGGYVPIKGVTEAQHRVHSIYTNQAALEVKP